MNANKQNRAQNSQSDTHEQVEPYGRITRAFAQGAAFIGYVTGGDPDIDRCADNIRALIAGGADLIEIGVPFSDPVAEGRVIQEANLRALAAGATLEKVLGLVRMLRRESEVPFVLLTYLNPVFRYGYEAFCAACADVGVDGVIVPDLPFEERGELLPYTDATGMVLISLVAPTSAGRVKAIASEAKGYLYLVSSLGVTGARSEIATDIEGLVAQIRAVSDVPVAVGFGIHTPEQARAIARCADGCIVGSALVELAHTAGNNAPAVLKRYTSKMKTAMC
ncbi:MAG: tryptophan synthase subunit alpha [Coriobacteriales bacterium]|jgi:tryptophan synthase alpha chain|nr:tryptophan synthase subunit alpha [Coriobacteriales bacterium]